MQKRRRARFLRRLALGLAVAAIASPAAQAYPVHGSHGGLRAEGVVCVPKWGCQTSGPVRPDDRAVRGVQNTGVESLVAPRGWPGVDPTTVTAGGASDQVVVAPRGAAPVVGVSGPSEVDLRDLGIGAGIAFALVLLVAGTAFTARYRHRSAAV